MNITTWDLFAAAWLAKSSVNRPHGEDDQQFATRQTDMAAAVADRMCRLKALRSNQPRATVPSPPMLAPEHEFYPPVESLPPTPSSMLSALASEVMPRQAAAEPSLAQVAGQPCWRAYNGAARGQGQDCTGIYDAQGVCKSCRLPYKAPGDPAHKFVPSYMAPAVLPTPPVAESQVPDRPALDGRGQA